MTLCELKTTSREGFVKYLPVKYISVKDTLRILKKCKNNNQKTLIVANFHKTFEARPIRLYNLCPHFMANDRSHKGT